MQSITHQFNARTTQFNSAWLAVFSLWLISDVEQSTKEKKYVVQRIGTMPKPY